jgi:hypothetical protein
MNGKLEKLIINGNNILAVGPESLAPMNSLVVLDMSGNLCINEKIKLKPIPNFPDSPKKSRKTS